MISMFIFYCCVGVICFIFFFDIINSVVILNNNYNKYVISLFYILCILAWPILIISSIEDKVKQNNNE